MSMALSQLVDAFGIDSECAQMLIPKLYRAIPAHSGDAMVTWRERVLPTSSKTLNTKKIATHYLLETHNSFQLIFAIHTYYAIVTKIIAASRVAPIRGIETIENGSHFRDQGIQNFTVEDEFSWYVTIVDIDCVVNLAHKIDFNQSVPDALKALYHDLFPRKLRHALGEYYTPDWFAHFVLNNVDYQGNRRLLDPTCGSGTFVTLAYRILLECGVSDALGKIAGIDVNPLACLSAKANLLLNIPNWDSEITLPIYCADVLLKPPDIGEFDLIIGNPPWVNWETLSKHYRQATHPLWEQYGLFPHSGFEAILGHGKKDLSLVLTYAVIDRYLDAAGTLAFIMTQSILKAGGAAEGFRRFDFGEKQIKPTHVDDFSGMRIFSGAETKPIVLQLSHDAPENPSYFLWKTSGKKTISEAASPNIIDEFTHTNFIAEPIGDRGSAWLTGQPAALSAVRKIIGQSDYTAHAGAYTGGANAVYWLDVLERKDHLMRVQNIVKGAKRPVPQVEYWIEAEFVYPLLRGRDVKRWQAIPTAHILVVQNPKTRQGYDEDWLEENYPLTYAYLAQFKEVLLQRATVKRYFRDDAPFYTMFDIGEYTFYPYKVVWHGFGKKRMAAVVVSSVNDIPIMSNQAMHPFIGLHHAEEAHYLAACLNSAPFEFAVLSHTQSGGKSFAQPGLLTRLRLPKFEPNNPHHMALVGLSQNAHQGKIDDDGIARHAAHLWNLTPIELQELCDSLDELLT